MTDAKSKPAAWPIIEFSEQAPVTKESFGMTLSDGRLVLPSAFREILKTLRINNTLEFIGFADWNPGAIAHSLGRDWSVEEVVNANDQLKAAIRQHYPNLPPFECTPEDERPTGAVDPRGREGRQR